MQTFTQLSQLYQSAAGVVNPQIKWAGVGFRAAPVPPPGTGSPTAFFWPRTVSIIDGSSGGRVTIGDTGWIPGDFNALQFFAQDMGIGPVLYDYWNIWVAESGEDMLSAPGSSLTAGLVYNPATGLYTSQNDFDGVVSGTVSISSLPSPIDVFNVAEPYSNIRQATGTVVAGTPVNITSSLIGGLGTIAAIYITNLNTSASILHVSIGGSGNAGIYVPIGATEILNPAPNPSSIAIWLESVSGSDNYEATALYV
jgi:hypothetical protein